MWITSIRKIKSFNPRTYIRYDRYDCKMQLLSYCFNPRTYIRYDTLHQQVASLYFGFNPRTYIRYDNIKGGHLTLYLRFNPRTYIRYDSSILCLSLSQLFQSTYLYKVRHRCTSSRDNIIAFQSTYLYKVRLHYK